MSFVKREDGSVYGKSRRAMIIGLVVACGFMQACAASGPAKEKDFPLKRQPGHVGEGYMLPNGWRITPAGSQIEVNDLPTNIAIHPGGDYAAVLSSGWHPHAITILDLATGEVADSVIVNRAWLGLCFNPKGDRLYVSGGNQDSVHAFEFAGGKLTKAPGFSLSGLSLAEGGDAYFWTGAAVHPDGKRLFAAEGRHSTLAVFDTDSRALLDSVNVGARPYQKRITLPSPTPEFPDGTRRELVTSQTVPYTFVFSRDGERLYISNWADQSVSVMNVKERVIVRTITVGDHPNDMALTRDGRLFVANANSNTVSVIDTRALKVIETISTTLYPLAPEGSTPNAVALDEAGGRLYVANADNNCLAVIDVSDRDESRVIGFIPTGWYPSSVVIDAKRNRILVGNGKGLVSSPNPKFLGPRRVPPDKREAGDNLTTKRAIIGAVSLIPIPDEAELKAYSFQVYANCPYDDSKLTEAPTEMKTAIPSRVGDPSPIKYVIYIMKENRTYDQVFGDLPQGNGDPDICLFPREVSPNHHKLAESFVLLDNFYADAEVSADGWEWTTAAYATDFVEKTWQSRYGRKGRFRDPTNQLGRPPSLYIWDHCARYGVSYVTFDYIRFSPGTIGHTISLRTDQTFANEQEERANNYRDRGKIDNWIREYDRFAETDSMPRFQMLRLSNDHGFGSAEGRPTPRACVADNDQALGRLVEHVSKGRYWKETAIFVVEDDAQNGPDHVDCHRTVALAISPYTRRGHVDHTFYTTSSMLRTIELILGLPPMSQFDAAASPMFASFSNKPVLDAYQNLPPSVEIDHINEPGLYGAGERFNKMGIDQAPDLERSIITWKAIKGRDSVMPAPVRRAFLFKEDVTLAQAEEDDD